jgi:hypothetical protein
MSGWLTPPKRDLPLPFEKHTGKSTCGLKRTDPVPNKFGRRIPLCC